MKLLKLLIIVFVIFLPFNVFGQELSATRAVLYEPVSGRVLLEKNKDEKCGMASTTKILTAITALEYGNLNDVVTVSKKAADVEGSSVWLEQGEKQTMENLLYGLMLSSGNDAAIAIAEYISGLTMSAFVMDYDHNAPDATYLQKTHEQFYKIVREKNPELPILLITKPDVGLDADSQARRAVVMKTFLNACENDDKHIYFLDGYSLFPSDCRKDCTVDGCHPNDLGMYFIAEKVAGVLKEVL